MSVTLILIGITVGVSFYGFSRPTAQAKMMMNPWAINKNNEYWRFLTSGFIHKDHMHLILNMFSFYFLGSGVERVFQGLFGESATYNYLALYLLGIIVSDVPTYFKQQNNPSYNSLGASGGVAAIVFAFIILQPMQYICIYFALCMPGFILGALYIAYSYFQGKRSADNINHDAHLYGSLFGLIFCFVMYPASIGIFWNQVSHWLLNIFN